MFKAASENVAIAPHQVWHQHGEAAPTLQPVAEKVLSAYCAASMCERNWKDYSIVHTKVRNRLGKRRAERLLSVRANSRALEHARLVPEGQYNWVGPSADGELGEIDDSDGDLVDELLVDSGLSAFADEEDEVMGWDLGELDPSVLDMHAASCFDD